MIVRTMMAKSYQYALQRKMQVLSDNIANIMTPGFKAKALEVESNFPPDFEKLIKAYEKPGDQHYKWEQKTVFPEYATSLRIAQITRNFNTGAVEVTNQPYDIAVENGKGMFMVRQANGVVAYTRAGNFAMDADGWIVDRNGNPLEPSIKIPLTARDVSISAQGEVFAKLNEDVHPRQVGQVMLAEFPHPEELNEVGQNKYIITPMSGEPQIMRPGEGKVGEVRQGVLELSNVDMMGTMFDMLICQRAFEMSTQSMSNMEEIMKYGADLRK
jgi:flagellar basal-body rod protein FlgG